jgi:hypothetical protein
MTQDQTWRQPAPTKAFALWHNGKWYSEGDTAAAAWSDARATIAPASPKFWCELRTMGRREPRSPWTRSLLKGSTDDLAPRQQRRGGKMTMRQLYNENAFLARVNFAEKCFRNHQTHTRAMDTCFEMYDGAAVVVALVRRARLDHALYVAIASDWSDRFPAEWLDLETKYSHIPTERLANLARQLRAAAHARDAAQLSLLALG